MAGEKRCPDCGEALPEGVPASLCESCMLGREREAEVTVASDPTPLPIEHIEELDRDGATVGNYRLLRKIGEGGMGYVYAAEQRAPVRRKVAIKVIKPGMDSREVLARFDAERHTLALMDHPNIARVLDAGAMKNGRPYFVMDLVTGLPITEYCDKHKLGLADRLELFHQVCLGVHHAHQKAIIHRDIKPSNVVVTVNSGQAIPKVIDFGIAKAMGSELTMQTYYTYAGQVIGTPQYMSPEQAGGDPADIDTRSDIYSLGVLLDELLTGQTPIAGDVLRGAGLDEMLRMVKEQEGTRPSTQLARLDEGTATEIARKRGMGVGRLSNRLKGDLDWLVLMALEKDRSRRYETANALGNDIRAFLHNEAIIATPPTLRYRLGKAIRRHKGPITAVAAIGCVLVVGLVASIWQAKRAGSAEDEAVANLRKAKSQQVIAEAARDDAEAARDDADRAKDEAEKTLEKLIASRTEVEQGKISLSELNARVNQLLTFLRSEPIRTEFQKKDVDGLEVVRSIDEMIGKVFEQSSKSGDHLAQDYELAMKLGSNAITSVEVSLVAAQSSFASASQIHEALKEGDADPGPIELGIIRLRLAEIARMSGRYDEALSQLDLALEAIAPLEHRDDAAAVKMAVLLERAVALGAGTGQAPAPAIAAALEYAGSLPADLQGGEAYRLKAHSLALETGFPPREGLVAAAEKALDKFDSRDDQPLVERLAAAQTRLLLAEQAALAEQAKRKALLAALDPKKRIAMEAETPDFSATVSQITEAIEAIRKLAKESTNRPAWLLELQAEARAAAVLAQIGYTYEAIQHHQRCLDRSAAMLRVDAEVAAPLESRFQTGLAMAEIYAGDGEHGKRLAALEVAYDALLEVRRRGMDIERYEAAAPDLLWRMARASVELYYVASGLLSVREENAFYADRVNYFGSSKERRWIFEDQQEDRQKYSHRLYKVYEIVRIPAPEGFFRLKAEVKYWVADPDRENIIDMKKVEGDGDITMFFELAFDSSERLKIVSVAQGKKNAGSAPPPELKWDREE